MNFHQLRLFYVVAQCGSFSRAAEKLSISQPAVSAQVKEFEKELALQLFERGSKIMYLTEAGKLIQRYAQQIFAQANELERAIEDLKGLAIGRLTIASSTTVAECILPHALGLFKTAYPAIQLEMQIANSTKVVEWVSERHFDLGFIGNEIESDELVIVPLCEDEIGVFVATNHPLANRKSITPEELAQQLFVARERGSATRLNAERVLQNLGIKPKISLELGGNEAVKRAVCTGLGVGMLSIFSLTPEIKAGMVKIIPVEGLACYRNFTAIYRRDKELTSAEKRLLEVVRESINQIS
ncbi:LysR family transcriptional regulator [Candidatus Chlorohelix sp.]|uniref:LysR family transcriptional regulator n=1 Tax=Candidatus Chlorohelix sp. TaxID=3139201 RepID=UPI003022BF9F